MLAATNIYFHLLILVLVLVWDYGDTCRSVFPKEQHDVLRCLVFIHSPNMFSLLSKTRKYSHVKKLESESFSNCWLLKN